MDLRGRVVRLGPAVDEILNKHDYPPPVSKLLGEAIVLCTLLGASLKFEGRFILQTQSDGAVNLIVVDFVSPGRIRAYARFDARAVAAAMEAGEVRPGALLGRGHLAMTIDQGPDMNRYQGLVALEGHGLEAVAHEYFRSSEQIPTRVRLAVAEEIRSGDGGPRHRWRAGGIMLQYLPKGSAPAASGSQANVSPAAEEAWNEGRAIMDTVEDIEIVDPAISSERLVYRLFHERGVRVFREVAVRAQCSCSREAVERMLRGFPAEDRADMVDNGVIGVTCEFCNARYTFAPQEIAEGSGGGVS